MEEQQKEKSSLEWAKQSQWFLQRLVEKRMPATFFFQMLYLNQTYHHFVQQLLVSPEKKIDLQRIYWQELFFIWQRFMQKQSNRLPAVIQEGYLLHIRHFQGLLQLTPQLDKQIKKEVQFYLKQITAFLSSLSFEVDWTNLETQTDGLLKSLAKVVAHLERLQEG